jgi:nucleotide-binding universal stress UspA family protein
MTIVVAYYGSDAARRALAEAVRRAGIGGKVLIVPPRDWIGRPDYQRILSTHRGRSEALLEQAAADPVLASVTVETDLLGGLPQTRSGRPPRHMTQRRLSWALVASA